MDKFFRDSAGAVLVEAAIVFPLFILLVFGTIDVAYAFFDWNLASKAAYIGARTAAVSAPVAIGINSETGYDATKAGFFCFDFVNGQSTSACPVLPSTRCSATTVSSGSCDNGYNFDSNTFFQVIFPRMQAIFRRLQPQEVAIRYTPSTSTTLKFLGDGSGFVGRPGGLPMDITVSLCVTHQFFFLSSLLNWTFPTPDGCPADTPPGLPMPSTTTLPSEDMVSN